MKQYVMLFLQCASRELKLHLRQLRLIINACLFFLMVIVFFPLTMNPDPQLLRQIAPGLVWIAVLLAMFLSADKLFQHDYEDGVIEQWLASGYPLSLMVFAKISIHWLLTIGPILIFIPLLSILFKLNLHETNVLILSLICGTPAILCLCTLASTFETGIQQKGMLMALILLPLTVPIMIFGSGTLLTTMQNLPINGSMALLLAISIICIGLLPYAIAGAIRIILAE